MPPGGTTIVRSLLVAALFVGAAVAAGCAPVSHWPPAVTSVNDIEELPTTQSDIRGIGIGDAEIERIAERFPQLKYLFLNSTSQITDRGVISVSKMEHVRQIVINDGSGISDRAMTVLASMPSLVELIIDNGVGLTDASLDAFAKKKNLQLLYLNGCSQLTSEAKERIRRQLPECRIRFDL